MFKNPFFVNIICYNDKWNALNYLRTSIHPIIFIHFMTLLNNSRRLRICNLSGMINHQHNQIYQVENLVRQRKNAMQLWYIMI